MTMEDAMIQATEILMEFHTARTEADRERLMIEVKDADLAVLETIMKMAICTLEPETY